MVEFDPLLYLPCVDSMVMISRNENYFLTTSDTFRPAGIMIGCNVILHDSFSIVGLKKILATLPGNSTQLNKVML